MNKKIQKAISTWILAAIVLVIGILCIVTENAKGNSAGNAYVSISYVMGITLIVISGLGIILNTIVKKRSATSETIADGFMLALGVYFVCDTALGGTLLSILVNYIPYLLIVVGGLILVDSVLVLIMGIKNKVEAKTYIMAFSIELSIAAIAIVLGVLALPVVDVISAKFTILGIIMIIYAFYEILYGLYLFIEGSKKDKEPEVIETIEDDDVVAQA